ncbi:hypothetical protein DUD61_004999 [Geotrichum candidum]|nr:hypothetical protein DUD61_004999 [Geotrichum candidum]
MTDPFNPKSFPLHDAARDGNENIVRQLIRDDPKAILAKDEDERTPLFWAASSGNALILSMLLKAISENKKLSSDFDIDDTDAAGWTLAHIAASIGSVSVLEALLPYDPDLTATSNNGQIPLHLAVSKGHTQLASLLISKQRSVGVKDKFGQAPLHRAAAIGSLPLVKLLIDAKAPLNATDVNGWTPLHHALAEGHGEVAIALIEAGANYDVKDSEGKTALQVAADSKTEDHVRGAIERLKK